MRQDSRTRRQLLGLIGGGVALGTAGCAGSSDGSPAPSTEPATDAPAGTDQPAETTESTETPAPQRPTSVVGRDGTEFVLGGQRYVFSGVANCCLAEGYTSRARVDSTLAAAERLDVDVLRFKCGSAGGENTCAGGVDGCDLTFQPRPGEFNELAFEHLDYIVAEAGRRGIRVIIPFVDNWGADGMAQYVEWAGGGENADFYAMPEAQERYRGFIETLLTRTNTLTGRVYREDPTVLMWELANEPRLQADGELLRSWVAETADFIHDLEVAQLVSTGSDIYPPEVYETVHAVDGIDACSIHLWPQNWDEPEPERFGREYIADRVRRGHETVGKPVYLGEYGWRVNLQAADAGDQISRRNELFGAWHDAALAADVDGVVAWELLSDSRLDYHRDTPGEGETVGFACPEHERTCEVLRSVASRVDERSGTA